MKLHAVIDACHSGSVMDLPFQVGSLSSCRTNQPSSCCTNQPKRTFISQSSTETNPYRRPECGHERFSLSAAGCHPVCVLRGSCASNLAQAFCCIAHCCIRQQACRSLTLFCHLAGHCCRHTCAADTRGGRGEWAAEHGRPGEAHADAGAAAAAAPTAVQRLSPPDSPLPYTLPGLPPCSTYHFTRTHKASGTAGTADGLRLCQ